MKKVLYLFFLFLPLVSYSQVKVRPFVMGYQKCYIHEIEDMLRLNMYKNQNIDLVKTDKEADVFLYLQVNCSKDIGKNGFQVIAVSFFMTRKLNSELLPRIGKDVNYSALESYFNLNRAGTLIGSELSFCYKHSDLKYLIKDLSKSIGVYIDKFKFENK